MSKQQRTILIDCWQLTGSKGENKLHYLVSLKH
jgi:hypothetical protein